MSIEFLSSEISFEIFDFLDHIDILRTFHHPNNHFYNLLLTYFRVSPRLSLQSMTKSQFHTICRHFIPYIADHIHALRLSNDDDTPQQIDLFLSYGLSLYRFPHLNSLSLHGMHSESIINRMMIEWQYPAHLTHLNITNCRVADDWNVVDTLINNIWNLPKLTHCQLDINVVDEVYSIVPTVFSPTLEYLSIKNLHCNLEELVSLFEHTPRLRYLDITVHEENGVRPYFKFSVPLMMTLKLTYKGPFDTLRNLMENVPNLRQWTIRTEDVDATGDHWAEIISNHLPKLKIFHLLMILPLLSGGYFRLAGLVNTYKSDFWLKKHQWYIRSHSFSPNYTNETIILYTLPYTFDDYSIPFMFYHGKLESNFSNFNDQMLYERVHHLSITSLLKYGHQLRHRFHHIYDLSLNFPCRIDFWSLLPTFDHLKILNISFSCTEMYDEDALFQFQTLLDRSPKLHSVTFDSSITLVLPLLECRSKSIIKLDLQTCDEYFRHSDCAILFLTTLEKQCQILSLKIHDRMEVLQFVKAMPQLRTLNIEFPPDKYKTENDDLVKWLRHRLPSTCTLTRDSTYLNRIQLWIG